MSFWIRHSTFVFPIVTTGVTLAHSSLSMLNKSLCVMCIKEMNLERHEVELFGWFVPLNLLSTRWNNHVLLPTWAIRGQREAWISSLKLVCEFVAQIEVNEVGLWMRKLMHAGAGAWMCETACKLLERRSFCLPVYPRMTNSSSFYDFCTSACKSQEQTGHTYILANAQRNTHWRSSWGKHWHLA